MLGNLKISVRVALSFGVIGPLLGAVTYVGINGFTDTKASATKILATHFNRPSSPITRKTSIVIMQTMAEDDRHVVLVPSSEIEPAPSFDASIRPERALSTRDLETLAAAADFAGAG